MTATPDNHEQTTLHAEQDRLREALIAVYEAFRDSGLEESYPLADAQARAALTPTETDRITHSNNTAGVPHVYGETKSL